MSSYEQAEETHVHTYPQTQTCKTYTAKYRVVYLYVERGAGR